MSVGVIGSPANRATGFIVAAWQALGIDVALLTAPEALAKLGPGDVALVRLDVLRTLDGVEDGLLAAHFLEQRGVRVLNRVEALLGAHDKLRTARLLAKAHVPHPETRHVTPAAPLVGLGPPLVLKPRFGSWGEDVVLCRDEDEVARGLDEARRKPWFRRHGAIAQEAVPTPGYDLRVVIAGGRAIGAIERVAAPGEWRTNVSCGATGRAARLSEDVRELARTAAAAIGADLVGVDLIPLGDDRCTVLELNGAVEFDQTYSLAGRDVFEAAAQALRLLEPVRVPA